MLNLEIAGSATPLLGQEDGTGSSLRAFVDGDCELSPAFTGAKSLLMKLRHAAALALVGWYLMLPPMECIQKAEADLGICAADLWEWREGPRFSTTEACNASILRERHLAGDLEGEREAKSSKCVPWKEVRKARRVRRAKLRPPVPDSDEPHPRIIESDPSGNVIEVY